MKPTLRIPLASILGVLLLGCTPSDDRLVNPSREANKQQAPKNALNAQLPGNCAAEPVALSEAIKLLIEQSGANQRELLESFDKQSGELTRQRDLLQLDASRWLDQKQQLAAQRVREPIIAQAILCLGFTLACLTPLALCVWLFAHANRPDDLGQAVSELLVLDLVSRQPLLTGPDSHRARLGYQQPEQGPQEPLSREEFPF